MLAAQNIFTIFAIRMFKKWVHIFLAIWLINSVTYFHGSSYNDLFNLAQTDLSDGPCIKLNTWTDCILQSLFDDADPSTDNAHKIKSQRRYLHSRTFSDSIFLSVPSFTVFFQHFKNVVADTINHYTVGVAMLPAYYNFLFRLSPF